MNGKVAAALTELLGQPVPDPRQEAYHPGTWLTWRVDNADKSPRLFLRSELGPVSESVPVDLLACYGDFGGGFPVYGSLRMAVIDDQNVYGLYSLDELAAQDEVRTAKTKRPDIDFFLDADNIWFYGVAHGQLVSYDSELDEFTELGELSIGLRNLITEWLDPGPA